MRGNHAEFFHRRVVSGLKWFGDGIAHRLHLVHRVRASGWTQLVPGVRAFRVASDFDGPRTFR